MISTRTQPKPELDLKTIRERVAAIKRNWTPAEVRERALAGRQRRHDLELLIEALASDQYECDNEHALVS